MTSRRYLAWFSDSISSALMYFSTPQMVHVQFERLPMTRSLRPKAQYGLSGIGTWSRLISTVMMLVRDSTWPSMNAPREGRILRSVLTYGVFFRSVTANAYSTKKRAPDLVVKSYSDAGYFGWTLRAIEVIIGLRPVQRLFNCKTAARRWAKRRTEASMQKKKKGPLRHRRKALEAKR